MFVQIGATKLVNISNVNTISVSPKSNNIYEIVFDFGDEKISTEILISGGLDRAMGSIKSKIIRSIPILDKGFRIED